MRTEKIIPGNIYHVYNRGVDRQKIFFSERNMSFFLIRLRKYLVKEKAFLFAYCLMPNHYHQLIKVTQPDFGQKMMHPFMTSYTKSINLQQNRVGPLFQGSFKAKMMPSDEAAIYCSKYIHLNPVKAKLVNRPEEWDYSSYQAYMKCSNHFLINPNFILSYFKNRREYELFVSDGKDDFDDSFKLED